MSSMIKQCRDWSIGSVPSPGALYSSLMDMIVRLARSGLIHGDFNEFNLLRECRV
jgi:RIO-like serine/threonine protein kinase